MNPERRQAVPAYEIAHRCYPGITPSQFGGLLLFP